MNKTIPNPENGTIEDIEIVNESTPDKKHSWRLMAIRLLLEGRSRSDITQIMNRSESTIIRWINRWNKGGIDALATKPKSGRPPKAGKAERQKIIELMNNPQSAGQTHWTGVKLWGYLKEVESIKLGYSTLARLLHEENFCLKVPRSWPAKQDPVLRAQFRNDISIHLKNNDIDLWFCDESGFLADPRPRRVWAVKGSKIYATRTGIHLRESIVGAVCPKSGALSALVISHVDTDVFQAFLDQLAHETKGRNIVLVLDNASWHKAKKLEWHHIKPMYLPPYSPDLNPIERLWLVMKDRFFTQWYTNEREILIDRVCEAAKSLMKTPDELKSICAI
jgi:transposase